MSLSSSCVLVSCSTSEYREKFSHFRFIRYRLRVKITQGATVILSFLEPTFKKNIMILNDYSNGILIAQLPVVDRIDFYKAINGIATQQKNEILEGRRK